MFTSRSFADPKKYRKIKKLTKNLTKKLLKEKMSKQNILMMWIKLFGDHPFSRKKCEEMTETTTT